jgi:hypothetical protein
VDLPPRYAYAYCGTVSRGNDMPRNKRVSAWSWRGFSVSITAPWLRDPAVCNLADE